MAPVTAAFVIGFIIWTHVTAGKAFFLNLIELLAILAVLAAAWLVYDHREGLAFAATTVTIASCIIALITRCGGCQRGPGRDVIVTTAQEE